ncbi:hypothetical protein ABC725_003692 [Escherichia coli]|nr:hypothetical protein [Escherichia coli]EIY6516321.1 hypothetical protein [Escherichia coli]
MRKITTAEALAAQIQDGATIAISGNGAAWWKLTILWPPLKRVSCKPDTRAT